MRQLGIVSTTPSSHSHQSSPRRGVLPQNPLRSPVHRLHTPRTSPSVSPPSWAHRKSLLSPDRRAQGYGEGDDAAGPSRAPSGLRGDSWRSRAQSSPGHVKTPRGSDYGAVPGGAQTERRLSGQSSLLARIGLARLRLESLTANPAVTAVTDMHTPSPPRSQSPGRSESESVMIMIRRRPKDD